jgi:tRNA-specific 2-thiouridylase
MSGGVDSSVAAVLTIEAGFDVVGLTMRLANTSAPAARKATCCSPAEIDTAREVCRRLGVPHFVVDERERFERAVIDDFVREYARGRTPNPCARCNEHVKFTPLLARARALGADVLVTGHYARIVDEALHRARDASKDQSYFLFAMGRENLAHVRFPLGDWSKHDVRARARALGLPNAEAAESQELCFVPGGDHGDVVEAEAARVGVPVEALAGGEIRDEQGVVLGRHRGLHRLTVGQRRGVGVAGTQPRYVLRVLPEEQAVVVGGADALATASVRVESFRRMSDLGEGDRILDAMVQIRHRGEATGAQVRLVGDDAFVEFERPVRAVAPGQAAVVYRGDHLVGGGWIA